VAAPGHAPRRLSGAAVATPSAPASRRALRPLSWEGGVCGVASPLLAQSARMGIDLGEAPTARALAGHGCGVFSHPREPRHAGARHFGISYTAMHGTLSGKDAQLYEDIFSSAGVSEDQFLLLLRHGVRCRVGAGNVIVEAGQPFGKVILMVSGRAVAYRRATEEPDEGYTDPVCKYIGKLDLTEALGKHEELIAPVRGSVIGGSAIVDSELVGQVYPTQVLATTDVEWIEWRVDDLLTLIHAQKMRALQASFYQLLYVELIDTLKRDRKVRDAPKKSATVQQTKPPSTKQLLSLSAFVAVPFFGFGVADNGIMIICGDFIDAKFGAVLGLSTMAAAGLGNWVSDTIGLGIGDAIERSAGRFGLSNGGLTPAQERLNSARLVTLSAKIIGITLGCFAGMTPLLFLTPSKKEFAKEDLDIFDQIFARTGMTTSQFSALVEKGNRLHAQPGTIIVPSGKPVKKLFLFLHGEGLAYDESGQAHSRYVGKLGLSPERAPERSFAPAGRSARVDAAKTGATVSSRGSLVGAKAFVDENYLANPRKHAIVASTPMEWMEWDLDELEALSEEAKTAVRASFVSLLYSDVIANVKDDKYHQSSRQYRELVAAVTADGYIDDKERAFLLEHKRNLGISDEVHSEILTELGWTESAWERGTITAIPAIHNLDEASHEDLLKAAALLEQVARSMRT